ncbi:MAG: SDR family oxidoreductase [Bacteroidales bacterium]
MNIIITGGSRGIGLETAIIMAKNRDNKIIITGRNRKNLEKAASYAPYRNISYLKTDFTVLHKNSELVLKSFKEYFESVDILINNAGYLFNGKFEETDESEIRLMMEVNFFAPAALIKLLLPLMHSGSHIVNISSMGGYQGSTKFPGLSYYSASKAAIACLTECLAAEFSDKGIRVNCIAPGSVQTDMFNEAFPELKANLTPEEMGRFIAWFAVNGNKFFNGKILPVALTTS